MIIEKSKKNPNSWDFKGMTTGKVLALKHALETIPQPTILQREILQTINNFFKP